MTEQPSALRFPPWLIAVDLLAAVLVAAGLLLRNSPDLMQRLGLPAGADLLVLGLGAFGVVGCSLQFVCIVLATAAARRSSPTSPRS